MTSRELVHRTLAFQNKGGRAPRDLWLLPWAQQHEAQWLSHLRETYTWDLSGPQTTWRTPGIAKGDPYAVGESRDNWGCLFTNIQPGVHGEVKQPIVMDEDWADISRVHFPEEELTFDVDEVNRSCAASDKFMLAGACPRPFEQLQFIRGTAELFMDLLDMPAGLRVFLGRMHDFYCRQLLAWAKTDVDALRFMDDWGTQRGLLISPALWRQIFGPMYREYIHIAHSHGKKIFMHSDGHTLAILPDLVEMGLDAINAQLFCIGLDQLAPFKGKITFWGEIDRQQLLPFGTTEDIDQAVQNVHATLWQDGGCIAQCEFGAGAKGENVAQVYRSWDRITGQ